MRLSVLDQSPVLSGRTTRDALLETLALGRLAESLGYFRYWLAEHHAIAALADPCPEVLLARLGAETKRMRIGTGGVLLPYYSAFRTAEAFRMLEALYPGRVDLGIGRAPGGDARTAQAVGGGRFPDADRFPEQVWELVSHLNGTLPRDHPYAGVRVQPEIDGAPPVWLLGSSGYGGALAAQLGLPFAFAHFINPRGGDEVAKHYRSAFKGNASQRQVIVCTFLICAETDEAAERLAAPVDLRRLQMALNIDAPFPTDAEATRQAYSEEDLARRYEADEVMLLTITGGEATRRRSYELVAQQFDLA